MHAIQHLVRRAAVFGAVLLSATPAAAQPQSDTAAPAPALVQTFRWRNIGPANMAGRVTDIEAVNANPAMVYVAAASGGVWKSLNAGTTWEPIFDRYGTANIGDLALFQADPRIVWVGTGEACVRNSVGWGDGVYRSTDGGKTFTNVGLRESHHIGRVVTHPTNPDLVYVAAQGHLWDHGGERGLFRTRDGGKTWQQLTRGLPDDGRTGATELVMDPRNPDVLYAGFWERLREPHRFTSGGENGGIFKSTDGGESWVRLTNGLPLGPTGKIGLAVFQQDPRILMAIIEHGYQPPRMVDGKPNPEYGDLTRLGSGIYRSEDGGASWTYVNRFNNRPFYYSHIYLDPNNANRVFVLATTAQVSEDGGRSFARSLEGISGDFHALWIDPANSNRLYVGNDKGAYTSHDGGHRFVMFDNMDLGQFYAVTLDNRDPYWVYGGLQDNGNWGGPSNSRDFNGILTDHWFKFHAGDGFHTTVDPNDWRTVYTEAQGGRIRRFDAVFRQKGADITPSRTNVLNLSSVLPDSVAPAAGGGRAAVALPRSRFRFNWSAPLILSPHDSRVIWFGGNHLFRSGDRGETWSIVSPDLSTGDTALANPESGGLTRDVSGAETHATIYAIAESPLVPGVVWAGTDDGNIQLTRDGGRTWTNVRGNLRGVPARTWVSRIEASRFDAATAYVVFDGHRRGDLKPWVFRTTDYGRTWTSLAASLPASTPVYVVREDPRNPRLLYAGTETGVRVSIDGGRSWHSLGSDLPVVPVYDLVIHPREGDLVAATHGRSIWILDNIGPLQQLTEQGLSGDALAFRNRVATRWRGISRGAERGHLLFQGRNPLTIRQRPPANSPSELENSATVDWYLRSAPASPARIEISEPGPGGRRFSTEVAARPGINRYFWPLRFDSPAAPVAQTGQGGAEGTPGQGAAEREGQMAGPGTYRVRITIDGKVLESTVTVREDPF
ncbi:MAG TPA: hypothetical protein VFO95_16865 [Gemmatimonadales bacterium]|nr:hypothetical protein [Gemmatimonadales bacterium]